MVDFPHKVVVPQRPTYFISRRRLHELLNAIANQSLITITGPAGYGKTSCLIDFANVSPLPVCWYTLDPYDEDPWVFLSYLFASIEQRFPGAIARTKALLTSNVRTTFTAIVASLVRELYTIGQDFVIIIDDWHVVDGVAEIRDIAMHLLLHCPRCHFILTSRTYPSLPNMMLLTARRQMSSLNENQLRFTAAEAAEVLKTGYEISISVEHATALVERADGWITGVLLSFQTSNPLNSESVLHTMSAERQIYRYLVEQVFDQQDQDVQRFLLDSALLEDLTPEDCDMILQRSDSRRMLERLLRHHLFTREIKPGVLLYHPLFREFLQEHYRTIDLERYRAMVKQVAQFYASQGQGLLAFDHYVAAGDQAAALQVIATNGEQLYTNGRLETLERLFAAIPEDQLDARLLCLKARMQLDLGRDSEAQVLAELAAAYEPAGDQPMIMLLQAQLARIDGRYEYALNLAQQILNTSQEPAQHAAALRTIGICHHRLGQIDCAVDELKEALAIEHHRGNLHNVAILQLDLGICYMEIGLLEMASTYYTQSIAYWSKIGNTGLWAMSLNCNGELQHLAGRYLEAHATLITALQYAREASIPHYQAAVLVNLGNLYSDLQLWSRASAAYADARSVGGSAYLMRSLDLADIRLLLWQRQYNAAGRALRQLSSATHPHVPKEVLWLSGSLACGEGHYDEAAQAVQQLIDALEQTRAPMELARAYLLQAQIAAEMTPTHPKAFIESLEKAAQVADQFGHDAFLVAEALHIRDVVRRAAANGWGRAENWTQRHHDMRLTMQILDQDDERPVVVVQTLGVDQIILNGQAVKLGWHKAREVLYYLLAHLDGAPIDRLCEAIWPDREGERSRDALRSAIYQLRSTLSHGLITLQGRQVYRLNRDAVRIDYDVERLLQIVESSADDTEALTEVLDFYRGPYLASVDSVWCIGLRTHLEQRYLQALHRTAAGYEGKHLYTDALIFYQRILAVDSLDEAAHAGIMRCQIALDNRAAAITQYHTLRHILDEELGLNPEPTSPVEQLYLDLLMAS